MYIKGARSFFARIVASSQGRVPAYSLRGVSPFVQSLGTFPGLPAAPGGMAPAIGEEGGHATFPPACHIRCRL